MKIEKMLSILWESFKKDNPTIGLHCRDYVYKNGNRKRTLDDMWYGRSSYVPGTKKEIIFTFRVTEYGVTCVTLTYYLKTGMREALVLHASKNACKPKYGTTWVGGGGVHSVPRGVYSVGGGISNRPSFGFDERDGVVIKSEYVDGETVKTVLSAP